MPDDLDYLVVKNLLILHILILRLSIEITLVNLGLNTADKKGDIL